MATTSAPPRPPPPSSLLKQQSAAALLSHTPQVEDHAPKSSDSDSKQRPLSESPSPPSQARRRSYSASSRPDKPTTPTSVKPSRPPPPTSTKHTPHHPPSRPPPPKRAMSLPRNSAMETYAKQRSNRHNSPTISETDQSDSRIDNVPTAELVSIDTEPENGRMEELNTGSMGTEEPENVKEEIKPVKRSLPTDQSPPSKLNSSDVPPPKPARKRHTNQSPSHRSHDTSPGSHDPPPVEIPVTHDLVDVGTATNGKIYSDKILIDLSDEKAVSNNPFDSEISPLPGDSITESLPPVRPRPPPRPFAPPTKPAGKSRSVHHPSRPKLSHDRSHGGRHQSFDQKPKVGMLVDLSNDSDQIQSHDTSPDASHDPTEVSHDVQPTSGDSPPVVIETQPSHETEISEQPQTNGSEASPVLPGAKTLYELPEEGSVVSHDLGPSPLSSPSASPKSRGMKIVSSVKKSFRSLRQKKRHVERETTTEDDWRQRSQTVPASSHHHDNSAAPQSPTKKTYPDPLPQGIIDPVVVQCVAYLNRDQVLVEEGLFRIPGDVTSVRKLRTDFHKGYEVDLMAVADPHTVCGLLKLHFREKRSSLIPRGKPLTDILQAVKNKDVQEVAVLIGQINVSDIATLRVITELFAKIVSHSDQNLMTPATLCASCAPSILPYLPPSSATLVLQFLMKHCTEVFME